MAFWLRPPCSRLFVTKRSGLNMQAAWRRKEPRHLDRHSTLTKSEAATLQLVEQGMAVDDICKVLSIKRETFKLRMRVIKEKIQ